MSFPTVTDLSSNQQIQILSHASSASFEKESIVKIVACLFFAIVLDVCIAPGAFVCLIMACARVNFNPLSNEIKHVQTPILLLHGSSFNESEWLVGRQFLKYAHYGSVFSMNYDGLILHDPKKGIDDYAKGKVRKKIKEIVHLTHSDRIILIGHSMGGLIASYYAEFCAEKDNILVRHVITIASPWQGAPIVDFILKYQPSCRDFTKGKRHGQMSVRGGTLDEPMFRQNLVASALASERRGIRKYYNIYSKSDLLIPGAYGAVTECVERRRCFSAFSHYTIIVMPQVWYQIQTWLNSIYNEYEEAIADSSKLR